MALGSNVPNERIALSSSEETSNGMTTGACTSGAHDSSPDVEKGTQCDPNGSDGELKDVRTITGFRWFLFISSTLTAIFVYALDNTIVANIVPAIVNKFDAVSDLPWLSVGFMIGGMAMVLPLGRLYALFDAKWIYISSTIVFMAASALCGAAPNMKAEIVGRVFAGAGGNGMYFGLLTIISMNTTNRERPGYLSLTGLVWGVGTVLGPVIGGGFELYTWRWAFYINLLFGAILLPIYMFVLPSNNPAPGMTKWQRLATFDCVGAVLSVGACITLVMGINFGGTLYPWSSGQIIALFVVTGALWIIFVLQQAFTVFTTKEMRMLPIHLYMQKEPLLLFVACTAVGAVSYTSVYYIPIYFQFTRGDTAMDAAARQLPFIFFLITAIPASGLYMSRVGYYKPCYLGGSIVAMVAAVLMATIVHVDTSPSILYGLEIVLGLGAGAYTQASFAVIQAVVAPSEAANGLSLMLLAQLGGLTLGLSVGGAVFVNVASKNLYHILPNTPRDQVQQMVSGTSGHLLKSLSSDVRLQKGQCVSLGRRSLKDYGE
ncbi:hypothetical protein CNMCM8980_007204 [Aspergillus fumigatiaffinis]|uniref:Major facilitator superfamily (MFS) profile domain-containing protein n=1 Tax=Aspergillus fumigatiaffinis TaxID=340414 RepID=A0A8H4M5W1_9EURO|nr:hypothetical protein CNMCM6457_006271 [Aspergillus fumigatiaffinis]KAF4244267.1 hypothetical protein CNMCM6805_009269 [Aspergillus fumigatiaffinis]KAF4247566.1 hypothetical protein CNMCM8980_007204 [Aspergillus fumigatiaffinis]